MRPRFKLTAAQVKAAGPSEKTYRLFDGGGLYLEVRPHATDHTGRYWRYKYRHKRKERRLCIGRYPMITLADARAAHRQAEDMLAQGIDPVLQKKLAKQVQPDPIVPTFKQLAEEYIISNPKNRKEITQQTARSRLQHYIYPHIGMVPIKDIDTPTMRTVLRKLERQGKLETLSRVRSLCSRVFRYAISSGIINRDPVADLAGALQTPKPGNLPAITKPDQLSKLMRDIAAYPGLLSRYALQITAYTLLRNLELRQAEWSEIDFNARTWRVPAARMKRGDADHIVPISKQCMIILKELHKITGRRRYVFTEGRRPMSENTPNKALHDMGYKGKHCLHGFRSSFSSIMNERNGNPDVIEACLAHAKTDKVRAAYNRAEYITARADLLQQWADLLTELEGLQT